MTTLHIEYPEGLLEHAKQSREALQRIAREALIVRLFDLGSVSSGRGAELLGITRREFLDLLGTYGVSVFDSRQDIAQEAHDALAASRLKH
jgi:predicted HTH domain antitoxin